MPFRSGLLVLMMAACQPRPVADVAAEPAAGEPTVAVAVSADAGTPAPDHAAANWTLPDCYAYAAARRSYACLDFAIGADSYPGEGPVALEQFRPEPGVSWYGRRAIVLVGPEPATVAIASKPYDDSRHLRRVRTERAARARVARLGFRPVELDRIELPSGRWVELGGARVRFTSWLHEGDASAHYGSSLELRCERAAPPIELAEGSRGELAIGFRAPGADSAVVGLREWSGGEGSGYYQTRYLLIDPAARCR